MIAEARGNAAARTRLRAELAAAESALDRKEDVPDQVLELELGLGNSSCVVDAVAVEHFHSRKPPHWRVDVLDVQGVVEAQPKSPKMSKPRKCSDFGTCIGSLIHSGVLEGATCFVDGLTLLFHKLSVFKRDHGKEMLRFRTALVHHKLKIYQWKCLSPAVIL